MAITELELNYSSSGKEVRNAAWWAEGGEGKAEGWRDSSLQPLRNVNDTFISGSGVALIIKLPGGRRNHQD